MRFVVQRVRKAVCTANDEVSGRIGKGYVVLVGVEDSDTREIAERMMSKLIKMRIFEDDFGKTNLDLKTVGGAILMVSQFTLYADCRKGNRPSFTKAGSPDYANELYEYCVELGEKEGIEMQTGVFGADMAVSLLNDGPFTIILDSKELGY
ncbi:MAG: D-tyrosyl-tRNA(Tyr) deacylase [Eubacterium sp.]|nr:D-tyrosyl-tRNA(Tyr) deacylase [Eubacterium sp.]